MTDRNQIDVKPEAVQQVSRAVQSFIHNQAAALEIGRQAAAQKQSRIADDVRRRQQVLARARQATAQAVSALARCQENCGGLAEAARKAKVLEAEAERSLARAVKAGALAEEASKAIAQAASKAHQNSNEHGHGALGACRELLDKIGGIVKRVGVTGAVMIIGAAASNSQSYVETTPATGDRPGTQDAIVRIDNAHTEDLQQQWVGAQDAGRFQRGDQ